MEKHIQKEFKKVLDDLRSREDVLILYYRNDDYNYVSFIYNKYLYYIQPSSYYLISDMWEFIVYEITHNNVNTKRQISYPSKYVNFDSLKEAELHNFSDVYNQYIFLGDNPNVNKLIKSFIYKSDNSVLNDMLKEGCIAIKSNNNPNSKKYDIISKDLKNKIVIEI